MINRAKVFTFSVLILIIFTCSILATRIAVFSRMEKQMAIQTAMFNLQTSIQSISISDDSFPGTWWITNNQNAVLLQVSSWLNKAIPYAEEILQSQELRQHAGNIGPARLYLMTLDKKEITIYPAFYVYIKNGTIKVQYVQDVIVFNNAGNITYLKSKELYNWLKTDQWKTEFRRK